MDFESFLRRARNHLDVTWLLVTPTQGRRIDVGEEFDIRLVIRNTFERGIGLPSFTDVDLQVAGTEHAVPVGNTVVRVTDRLEPGDGIQHVLRLRALKADPADAASADPEPVADVSVRGRLDIDALLEVETKPMHLRAQIYGEEESA